MYGGGGAVSIASSVVGWRVRSAMVLVVKLLDVDIEVEDREEETDGGKSGILIDVGGSLFPGLWMQVVPREAM